MALTTIVTRNAPGRIRGFLASVALEVSPGVYVGPQLDVAVRARIWDALAEWAATSPETSVVMVWRDMAAPGGVGIRRLGLPLLDLVSVDGVVLSRRALTS